MASFNDALWHGTEWDAKTGTIKIIFENPQGEFIDVLLPVSEAMQVLISIDQRLQEASHSGAESKKMIPGQAVQLTTRKPDTVNVIEEPMTNDAVLLFDWNTHRQLAVQIPRMGIPGFLQLLLPFLEQSAPNSH